MADNALLEPDAPARPCLKSKQKPNDMDRKKSGQNPFEGHNWRERPPEPHDHLHSPPNPKPTLANENTPLSQDIVEGFSEYLKELDDPDITEDLVKKISDHLETFIKKMVPAVEAVDKCRKLASPLSETEFPKYGKNNSVGDTRAWYNTYYKAGVEAGTINQSMIKRHDQNFVVTFRREQKIALGDVIRSSKPVPAKYEHVAAVLGSTLDDARSFLSSSTGGRKSGYTR